MSALLAKVALMRLLDTDAGTAIIQRFMSQSSEGVAVLGAYRKCLGDLAPGWDNPGPFFSSFRYTGAGWQEIVREIRRVPEFSGVPGTATYFPGCRSSNDGDWDISAALLIRTWALAHDDLQALLSKADFGALSAHVASAVWLEGGVSPLDGEVCGKLPETENHQLMIETTRLLHNELLPPADLNRNTSKWVANYDSDLNRINNTNGVAALLHLWFGTWARHDFLEYNARSYSRFQLLALLNVYDFSTDPSLRRAAGVVLDLLVSKVAAESVNGNRTAPFRRRAENQDSNLIGSDQLADAFQVWVGNMAPTGLPPAFANSHAMVLAATSRYRPPDVLADIALDPSHHNYVESFNGQNQGESAFGARDFTIAGGGTITPCPYPDHFAPLEQMAVELSVPVPGLNFILGNKVGDECKGSGNDRGVAEPIVLLPRNRSRSATANIPTFDGVIHSGYSAASTCIGVGVACAQSFVIGGPQPRPRCQEVRDLPSGDTIDALRYDESCVGADYRGLCFFVFIRSLKTRTQPFSYLVTHLCDPASSEGVRIQLFRAFVSYLTDGDGAPTRPTNCSPETADLFGSLLGALPQECWYSIAFTPPEQYGPIHAGQRVTMTDLADHLYTIDPPTPTVGVSAEGQLAQLSAGIPRLRLADAPAGEWVVEPISGGTAIDSSAAQRTFGLSATINGPVGVLSGQITAVDHPEALHTITASVLDETQVQHDCTTTLPNGQQGCYAANLLCGDPPVPCTTGVIQPMPLPAMTFAYDLSPAAGSQPISFGGGVPSVDSTHTYVVNVCLTWYRFYTAEDYYNDPTGAANDNAHETCETESVKPTTCTNPLLCETTFVPLTQQFPNLSGRAHSHPTVSVRLGTP